MGPTGAPTEIPADETVVLAGGGLGNAVLFSIGQALREAGSRVIYFAGYKKMIDRYKVDQIERAADQVVWCCDEGPGFEPTRPHDKTFVGNIVAAYYVAQMYRPGQTIRVGEIEGRILRTTTTALILDTKVGQVHLPASVLSEQPSMLVPETF